jgi:tetratricopeptide (TPR) repeat protein
MGSKPLIRALLFAELFVSIGCCRMDGQTSGAGDNSLPDDPAQLGEERDLTDADAYAARAYDRLCQSKYDPALRDYDRAIELDPLRAAFWNARGFTWHMKGIEDADRPACEDRALSDYAEAIRLDPNYASAINNRAWLRATSKVDRCRDGKQAVAEATRACELTAWKNPGYLDTLSVANAEIGDFEQAVRWQKKALDDPSYEREEGRNARTKLALYRKQQAFRE